MDAIQGQFWLKVPIDRNRFFNLVNIKSRIEKFQ